MFKMKKTEGSEKQEQIHAGFINLILSEPSVVVCCGSFLSLP